MIWGLGKSLFPPVDNSEQWGVASVKGREAALEQVGRITSDLRPMHGAGPG